MAHLFLQVIGHLALLSELFGLVKLLIVVDLLLILLIDFYCEVGEKICVYGGSSNHYEAINKPFCISRRYYISIPQACHCRYNEEHRLNILIKSCDLELIEVCHGEPA